MSIGRRLRSVALLDLRLVGRDRFLLGVGLYVAAMCVLMRFLLPGVRSSVLAGTGFDLARYYPLLASYLSVFMGSMLAGIVYGFTTLESREDGTARAVLVSPLPNRAYTWYRVVAPAALAAVLIPAMAVLVGVAVPRPGPLLAISLLGAGLAPAWALATATYADNKVSAFALLKALSGSGLILIGSFFLDPPVQYAAGLYPPYWVAKAYWVAVEGGSWWVFLALGTPVILALDLHLARRLTRVAHR